MPEIIACPYCQQRLRLPAGYAGGKLLCPACKGQFTPQPPHAESVTAEPPGPRPPVPPLWEAGEKADEHVAEDLEIAAGPPAEGPVRRRRRPRHAPPPRRTGLRRALLAAGICLAALGLFALAWNSYRPARRDGPAPDPFPAMDERARRELAEAFRDQKPLNEQEIAAELRPLLEGLRDAFRAADADRLLQHFDADRMCEELEALNLFPRAALRDRQAFTRGMRQGLGQTLQQQAVLFRFDNFEVRNVKKLRGNEAAVIVRYRAPDGGSAKIRWWVTKRPGTWKVFDMEDLDVGLRVTSAAGAFAQAGFARAGEVLQAMNAVRDASTALVVRQDPDAADLALRQVAHIKLPGRLEALRALVGGMVQVQRGQFEPALKAFDEAQRHNPDMPCLDLFRGMALNQLGRWDQALKHVEAYRDLLGEDGMVCFELAEALRGVGRMPEACAAYRKCLDYEPKNLDAFLSLLRALGPDDDRADLGPRFARLGDPHQTFETCAEDCRQGRDGEALEQLALVMRKLDPNYAGADYYLALARAWSDQPGEAVALFKAALGRQGDPAKRRDYAEGFLQAMAGSGHAPAAYAAAPDPKEAFRVLAGELKKTYRTDELKDLVDAHARRQPDDRLLPFYRGEVLTHEGHYAEAEKAFAAGLARPPDAPLEPFRVSRVLARYHTGKALSAYADVGPRFETFQQFASLCVQDQDYALLDQLVRAHTRKEPDDPNGTRYGFLVKIKQGNTAEAVALFKGALAKQQEERRKQLVSDFLLDMTDAGRGVEGYAAAPDAREAFAIVAEELLGQGRKDDFRKLLDAHRRRHPDDPALPLYSAELHLGEKAWDKAAQVLKDSLPRAPDDLRKRYQPVYLRAMYQAGRGLQAYQESESRSEAFAQLAGLLALDKKGAELDALVAAHRPHAGDDPEAAFFEARAKALQGKAAEGAAPLERACRKQPADFRRKDYVRQFVLDLADAGKGLEGYRAAPDKAEAFRVLAGEYTARKDEKELSRLLEEHGKAHAGDPFHRLYVAERHLLRGEVKEAEGGFAAALAKAPARDRFALRNGLYRVRIKAGKVALAYQEAGGDRRAFSDLANLCMAEKNAGQLEELIAAHRKARPDDPALRAWEVDARWLKQDYEGVLKLLAGDSLLANRYRWKTNSYRVRSLIKLKRFEEAVREAEALEKKQGDPLLLVLAHAAAGDVKRAVAAAEKARPETFLADDFYRDPELGPILRGEPFRPFRERFPEPKERPGDFGRLPLD